MYGRRSFSMKTYNIINISFNCCFLVSESFEKFSEKKNKKIYFKIETMKHDRFYYGCQFKEIETNNQFIFANDTGIMVINKDWTVGDISTFQSKTNIDYFVLTVFYTHAVQNHIIQFHSSLISHQNSGVMFLGPSGIGKTTQAELWNQYRDALIINGDIVFVQETEKNFLGWGTPWHGSSSYCENTSVPLRAMVVLKQAKENSIRELTGFEKVSEVSNHVFYPQWLENGMELCLETLDHLLTAIPVYELSCRPDEDAVRLTEETIFGT